MIEIKPGQVWIKSGKEWGPDEGQRLVITKINENGCWMATNGEGWLGFRFQGTEEFFPPVTDSRIFTLCESRMVEKILTLYNE